MPGGRDWCIKIVLTDPDDETTVSFEPDVPGGQAGDPLNAQATDLVAWNNRTAQYHQIVRADSSFTPLPDGALTDEILPFQNSTSSCLIQKPESGNQIFYVCKNHPDERGVINVN